MLRVGLVAVAAWSGGPRRLIGPRRTAPRSAMR